MIIVTVKARQMQKEEMRLLRHEACIAETNGLWSIPSAKTTASVRHCNSLGYLLSFSLE